MTKFTLIENIIRSRSDTDDKEIYPGNIVWVNLDLVTARDYAGPQVVDLFDKYYPDSETFDNDKIIFTPDCYPYGNDPKHVTDQEKIRVFSRKHNIRLTDLGSGIGSHLMFKKGYAKPGDMVIGADSHYNLLGALGILGQGAGDIMLAFAMKTGRYWIKIPETIKVTLVGDYKWPTTSKDLALFVLKKLHDHGITGKAVEFYGEIFKRFTIDERITLCSLITEATGLIGFVPPDEITEEYYNRQGIKFDAILADTGVKYSDELTIDIQDLDLYVACPPHPHNVKPIDEVIGTEINSVIIGSCTNSSVSDIQDAERVLKGKKTDPNTRFALIPATKIDFIDLNRSGTMINILESGGDFFGVGCSTCAKGQYGLTGGTTAVTMTTGNRNTQGKIGPANVYLASPAVAAATALNGKISRPEVN